MAINMPKRFELPEGMEEAILITETGLPPDELDKLSESTINNILIYRAIKNVSQNGGSLDL